MEKPVWIRLSQPIQVTVDQLYAVAVPQSVEVKVPYSVYIKSTENGQGSETPSKDVSSNVCSLASCTFLPHSFFVYIGIYHSSQLVLLYCRFYGSAHFQLLSLYIILILSFLVVPWIFSRFMLCLLN